MKRILATILTTFVVAGTLFAVAPSASATNGVTICHKGETISVNYHAVPAHLHHGDKLGKCPVVPVDPPVDPPVVIGPAFVPTGPGPYLQAYGLVTDPTCQLTVEWAKWEGVPDGGWTPSWHEWMNNGLGGEVCQRTVVLVDGAWTIAK